MKLQKKDAYLFSWKASRKPTSQLTSAIEALGIDTKGNNGFHILRKTRSNELSRDPKLDRSLVAELLGHTVKVMDKHYSADYRVKRSTIILIKAGYGAKSAK